MDTTMNHESSLPHLPLSEMDAQHLGAWSVPEQACPHNIYLPQLVAKQSWTAHIPLLPSGILCLDAVPAP